MNNAEFMEILKELGAYLKEEKQFEVVQKRKKEFEEALLTAQTLFPDAGIEVHDDPLEMGALILSVENYNIEVSSSEGMELFSRLTQKADNFEIVAIEPENVRLAIVFQGVLKRV